MSTPEADVIDEDLPIDGNTPPTEPQVDPENVDPGDLPDLDSLPEEAVLAIARRNGWRSAEELARMPPHKRPKGPVLSARQFLEKIENEVPLLRARLRAYDQREVQSQGVIGELNRKIDDFGNVVRQMHQRVLTSDERAYRKARADIQAEMDAAAHEGNREAYETKKREIAQLDADHAAAAPTPETPAEDRPSSGKPAPGQRETVDPAVVEWTARNPWFQKNATLNNAMIERHQIIAAENPGLTMAETLEMAGEQVKEDLGHLYPQFFDARQRPTPAPPANGGGDHPTRPTPPLIPRRRQAPSVHTPGGHNPSRPAKMTINDLPPDARAACEMLMSEIKGFTVDDYIETYMSDVAPRG